MWAAFLLILLTPSLAFAQSCTFSVSSVAFTAVDTLSGRASDSTATLSATCTGPAMSQVLVCPNLGEGSGGAPGGLRRMGSGANALAYQLFQDPARSIVWGSFLWPFAARPPELVVSIGPNGTGTLTRPIFARVLGRQGTVPPGRYLSAFAGGFADFRYGPLPLPGCAAMPRMTARASFAVTASVEANCQVETRAVDFGNQSTLSKPVSATGQLLVTCTAGTSYTVGLGGGQAGTAPTQRQMRASAGGTVTYGLYRDAAHSQPWGDIAQPGSVHTDTGSGQTQTIPVFGEVPAQATPRAGPYADTVAVTVTY